MAAVLSTSQTTWLNLTNAALGLAVLACAALIVGAVVYEFAGRALSRARIIRDADAAVRSLLGGHRRA